MKRFLRSKIGKVTLSCIFSVCLAACVILLMLPSRAAEAASTQTPSSVDDWNACAQNTVEESSVITADDDYGTMLSIQAFLDSTTAHTGTKFQIQISSADSGDEDWHDLPGGTFVELVGTANSENITDNPLAASSTTITVADTGGNYETPPMGRWLAIEDSTLANSELILNTGYTTDTNITIIDGTANEHAQNTTMYDIAFSKSMYVPAGANRIRVIVNNTYDVDGSTLNYRIRKVEIAGL